jgi:hypothetical protein
VRLRKEVQGLCLPGDTHQDAACRNSTSLIMQSPGPVKLPEKNTRGRPKQNPMHELAVGAGDVSNPLELLPGLREGWTGIRSTGLREVYEREPVYQLIVRFQDGGKELNFVEEDRIYEVSMGKGLLLLLD